MPTVLIIIVSCVFVSLLIVIYDLWKSNHFIKEYAEKHTIEEIEEMISEEEKLIESGKFKGIMLEDMLDRKEFWENIRKYKVTGKF